MAKSFKINPSGIRELARNAKAQSFSYDSARAGASEARRQSSGWENQVGRKIGVSYRPERADAGEARIGLSGFWHLPEFGTSDLAASHPLERGLNDAGLDFVLGGE